MEHNLPVICWDTETHRFGHGNLCPRLVCMSMAMRTSETQLLTDLQGRCEEAALVANIELLLSGNYVIAAHNNAYDFGVLSANYPQYIPRLFELLASGHVQCTRIREKLLNLTTTGDLEYMTLPDGSKAKIEYTNAWLSKFYLGKDKTEEKKSPDAWRTNFGVLEDVPMAQWPQGAVKYAIDDSADLLLIWEAQERRRHEIIQRVGKDPFKTLAFHTAVDYGLYLMSAWGQVVDPPRVLALMEKMQAEVAPEKIGLLIETGILRPGAPARPNALGHKNHVEGCKKKWVVDGRTVQCNCPLKMTEAVEESVNKAKLAEFVRGLSERNPVVEVRMTPPSDKFPQGQVSVDEDWLEEFAKYSPVLQQMQHRNKLLKVINTEIPRMMMKDAQDKPIMGMPATLVHPRFDVLKETGRTSSYGDKAYPSINGQNVDPRARECYTAPPGYVLFSVDYSQMELGTLGQVCLRLFKHSVIADKINNGDDLHAYLGAQIAVAVHDGFKAYVDENSSRSREDVYHMFLMYKESQHKDHRDFYALYRKLAKPTGLGYPGGLGHETFIDFAKGAPYHVDLDEPMAKLLREIWLATFDEMELYFKYIQEELGDPINVERQVKDKRTNEMKTVKLFAYESPMGMYRAGAVYCAAANGLGLQTPSSEGAKLALFNVVRACYDWSMRSILSDDERGVACRPTIFIHDEILGIVREDEKMSDRVKMVQRIMEEAMRTITPDVKVRTEACLMRYWSKDAKPKFDNKKNLIVWEPEAKKEVVTA